MVLLSQMTVVSVMVMELLVQAVHIQHGMMTNIVIHQTTHQSVDMMVVTVVLVIALKVV